MCIDAFQVPHDVEVKSAGFPYFSSAHLGARNPLPPRGFRVHERPPSRRSIAGQSWSSVMNTAAAARVLPISRSIICRISSRFAFEKAIPRLIRLAANGIRLFSTISPACSIFVVKATISDRRRCSASERASMSSEVRYSLISRSSRSSTSSMRLVSVTRLRSPRSSESRAPRKHRLEHIGHAHRLARGPGQRDRRRLARRAIEIHRLRRVGRRRASAAAEPADLAKGVSTGKNSNASAMLKACGNRPRRGRGQARLRPVSGRSSSAAASPIAHPTIRLIRLPIGRRLAAGSPLTPLSISGLIAVPRLAPSTSAKAACSGITPLAGERHDQQHDRDAGMRRPGQRGREQDVDQRVGRDHAEQHPQARRVLVGRDHRQQMLKRDQHQAEPDPTRPRSRVRVMLRRGGTSSRRSG